MLSSVTVKSVDAMNTEEGDRMGRNFGLRTSGFRKGHEDELYDPTKRIVVLVDNPHIRNSRWIALAQTFELYKIFPVIGDYLKAVNVLTRAGLLDRYLMDRHVVIQEMRWNVDHGHIRIE